MHGIVIASYLIAAATFLVATILLSLGWRGQRTGAALIVATTVSMLWGVLLANAEWQRTLTINWVMLAEMLRYGAWLVFITLLFGAWSKSGVLRGLCASAHVLWILLAAYCVLPGISNALPFDLDVPLVGVLLLSLAGVVLLEQILRNVEPRQRWALKFLVIALGGFFAYDIFLYSFAILYQGFDASIWAARGLVDALLVPLLLVAAARNPDWSIKVAVSRRVVFYSTSLMVVAFYIIATALGGYYVRRYGGDWGRVAEIALISLALLVVLMFASSGQARSRLKLFLHKNFFNFRHDYREEWLRLTATLAASDSGTQLSLRAVRALAQTMDSPAGILFMRDQDGDFVPQANWNMSAPAHLRIAADAPAFAFMRDKLWIYDLEETRPSVDQAPSPPPELAGLPRAWLLVPLVLEARLTGFVVLAQARARHKIDWEDLDLLRTAGSQVAGTLMQAADAQRLAMAQQFEGFNRLTAFLMHDLKNIAAQQSLLLQNAARHKHNPAFVDDMLATVDNSVARIRRVLEQLRGGGVPASSGRVDVKAVLDKALSRCQTQLPEVTCHPCADDLWIHADAERLASAVEHLVRNAQDAATPGGHVVVRMQHAAGSASIEIEDDGAGMDEEFVRDRLFKPFFTTKASKGMGIGAYQAREYVRLLGGTLRVDSVPGSGTTFTIRLPLFAPGEASTATDALGTSS